VIQIQMNFTIFEKKKNTGLMSKGYKNLNQYSESTV